MCLISFNTEVFEFRLEVNVLHLVFQIIDADGQCKVEFFASKARVVSSNLLQEAIDVKGSLLNLLPSLYLILPLFLFFLLCFFFCFISSLFPYSPSPPDPGNFLFPCA